MRCTKLIISILIFFPIVLISSSSLISKDTSFCNFIIEDKKYEIKKDVNFYYRNLGSQNINFIKLTNGKMIDSDRSTPSLEIMWGMKISNLEELKETKIDLSEFLGEEIIPSTNLRTIFGFTLNKSTKLIPEFSKEIKFFIEITNIEKKYIEGLFYGEKFFLSSSDNDYKFNIVITGNFKANLIKVTD